MTQLAEACWRLFGANLQFLPLIPFLEERQQAADDVGSRQIVMAQELECHQLLEEVLCRHFAELCSHSSCRAPAGTAPQKWTEGNKYINGPIWKARTAIANT